MTAFVLLGAKKFWILDPLYSALGTLVAWFYSVIPSYGFAIVLLTLAVRVITLPLTAKQARAQQQMQQLQPELKRLQAKYKHDKQKMQEEVMKFYRENHANPFGSCLPVLIQMPILIVLYRLILGLSDNDGPKHVPDSSELFAALRESGGEMVSWGMDLARSAAAVSGADKLPYLVLVALVVATGYYQQRQLTARVPKENVNPQMAMMTKIFPAMFGVISFSIPAGVVVYFLVSNIWQIGQQAVLFRDQPAPPGAAPEEAGAGGKGKAGTKGKGGAPPKAGGGKGSSARSGAAKGAGTRGAAKGGATKGAAAKGGAKGGPGGPPKGAPAKGTPAKGARKGSSGRVTPRDDRVKPAQGKGAGKAPPGRPGGGGAAVGAPGGKGGAEGAAKAQAAVPAAAGGPTGQGKRKRRGRRGRPGDGSVGASVEGVAVGGDGRAGGDGAPGSDGEGPAEGVAPTSTSAEDAQKGNDSWSG
ncbi:MAG TPA: YidC/Oxa1 family membrane protein insertase [Acidimicrobiales bacterium]|nr:YidC/Oxa1 family membrane protein insertase [Acidimicrobiales bacterium]